MLAKVCFLLILSLTLLGCRKSIAPATNESTAESGAAVAPPGIDQSATGLDENIFDPQARAESLRAAGGPFFIDPDDTVVEVRVFKPHEQRVYSLEEKEDYHVKLFMYVDAPPGLIEKVGTTEYGAPKVGLIKDLNDKFKNEQIGNFRVSAITTGNPPWEIAVENLTDQPLLFQIVRSEIEMTEDVKAMHREMRANRQRGANRDKFNEALEQWRTNPQGPAPKKEDYGL